MMDNMTATIPTDGFMRLRDVLRIVPVSRSSWFEGVKQGRFPKPVRLGPRTAGYRASDIRDLVERLSEGEGGER
jgi:prophage regulatory protein